MAEQPPTPPKIVSETVGFLLGHFNLQWAISITDRIKAIEPAYPGAWLFVQNWIELAVADLEKRHSSPRPSSSPPSSCEDEGDDSTDEDDDFAAGAAPVLPQWRKTFGDRYGYWAVQRVGRTATITNEVTERMDPRHFQRQLRQQGQPPRPRKPLDGPFFMEVTRRDRLFGAYEVAALDVVVTPANSREVFLLLEEWAKTRPHVPCVLKVPCAADFGLPPSTSTASTTTAVDCSALSDVIIDTDEVTEGFAEELHRCLNLRPTNSLQIRTKLWKLKDADAVELFAGKPRQLTISTPFVKRVAQFLATVPTCDQLVLPQFGMRTATPDYFEKLVAKKKHDRFGEIIVGDCRLSFSPTSDAMLALKTVATTVVVEHGHKPPMTELLLLEEEVKYTTAAAKGGNCSCSAHEATFRTIPNSCVAATTTGGELYLQMRCSSCNAVIFVRHGSEQRQEEEVGGVRTRRGRKRRRGQSVGADSSSGGSGNDVHRTVMTLFMESIPVNSSVLFQRLTTAFTEVETIYLGETLLDSPNAERSMTRFLCKFPKLKNVITLLPKHSDQGKFVRDMKMACPKLQRLCITKRHEALDIPPAGGGRFAGNVVPPPSKKDFVVSRVKWPVDFTDTNSDEVLTPQHAAAVVRCTCECGLVPFATAGLYLFKH